MTPNMRISKARAKHGDTRRLPLRHAAIRVPWHDTGWAGTVCQASSKNSWCMVRIGAGGPIPLIATVVFGASDFEQRSQQVDTQGDHRVQGCCAAQQTSRR